MRNRSRWTAAIAPTSLRRALPVAVVLLTCCGAPPSAGAQQLTLTPASVHRFAEEGAVVRGLLGIEDSLAYDAVALRPSERVLGQRIRERNQLLIGLCSAIIRDDTRIRRAERELGQAHAGQADFGPAAVLDKRALLETTTDATTEAQMKLEAMKQNGESISVADMFQMQILTSSLSQLTEMSRAVVGASNTAILSMARGVKG